MIYAPQSNHRKLGLTGPEGGATLTQGAPRRGALADKDGGDEGAVQPQCPCFGQSAGAVGGGGDDPARMAQANVWGLGHYPFGKVNPIGPDLKGKGLVCPDQQGQAAASGHFSKGQSLAQRLFAPKATIDDAAPGGQGAGDCDGIGKARRISHQP